MSMAAGAFLRRLRGGLIGLASALLLAACGGGGGGGDVPPSASCSVPDRQAWLAAYMNEWYFWYRLSPQPNPAGYASVGAYFDALLYTGTDPAFPADRWSWYEPTVDFNRFFGDGATMGYGVSVAGLEAVARPGMPLYVRYVEPLSDAAAQGVRRGDQVLSLNGTAAATLVARNDFALLTADREQQLLTLALRRNGADRTVTLMAKVFALTPVAGAAVFTSPGGRRIGYVAVKDMINQALNQGQGGLDAAFANFRAQGVQEAVLDLRYNGGGLVSVGDAVASYITGAAKSGWTFAALLYNDKRAAIDNRTFYFGKPGNALGLGRVFVLTGARTCSTSEQVINGLRGVGIEVVTVGDTTCGKPLGFLPRDDACGTTYNAVNFESVNARNEGRYFDGLGATCAVADDFTIAQGAVNDPLVSTATFYADNGRCGPIGPLRAAAEQGAARSVRRAGWVSDERSAMIGR